MSVPHSRYETGGDRPPPVFNAPRIIVVCVLVLLAAHLVVSLAPAAIQFNVLTYFAFVPQRYAQWPELFGYVLEGNITALGYFLQGWLPFVTHTLLHADFMHVGFNCIWLLAFGTPVAKRIGAARFLALAVVAAAAGAGLHLAFRWGSEIPMVGASGAVSGLFGAAVRFILAVPIGQYAMGSRIHLPRLPLFDRRVVVVTAVYLVINYALAVFMGTGGIGPESAGVAWDAHMGGYLAGLMLFPLFDPRRGEHASSSGGGGQGLNGSSGPNGGGSERPYLQRVK